MVIVYTISYLHFQILYKVTVMKQLLLSLIILFANISYAQDWRGALEKFEEVFKKALEAKGPVWIDCAISREERVLPMIPAGKTVEDMIIG